MTVMTTQQKIDAIIAAVTEHAAIYAGVRAPATPAAYDNELVEGLRKGLVDRITAVFSDEPDKT